MGGAIRLRLHKTPAGNDHIVPAPRQSTRQSRAKPTITAENQDPAQSTRSASFADGTQQTSRRPNSR